MGISVFSVLLHCVCMIASSQMQVQYKKAIKIEYFCKKHERKQSLRELFLICRYTVQYCLLYCTLVGN